MGSGEGGAAGVRAAGELSLLGKSLSPLGHSLGLLLLLPQGFLSVALLLFG
jgi:hypothetical protein